MAESYLERFSREPGFPTEVHERAAESLVDYVVGVAGVQAALLTCSCARGVAAPESCVDITLLVDPDDRERFMRHDWPGVLAHIESDPACVALDKSVPWSGIDIDFHDGIFAPGHHGWTTGADAYELEIGNALAWSHPLFMRGSRYRLLQEHYLPYYDNALRQERLIMVVGYATNNIEHIVPYARRGLYGQAFKRLYHALEETLQALFISRGVYPIAYDKWLREQLVDILGEPGLYTEWIDILATPEFSVKQFADRSARLAALLETL